MSFFLECWTHEEGKGWRRVHVGADLPVASPTEKCDDAAAVGVDNAEQQPGSSLIDLNHEGSDETANENKVEVSQNPFYKESLNVKEQLKLIKEMSHLVKSLSSA